MIQRQQSLWLLLATVAAILSFTFPFYSGTRMLDGMAGYDVLDAGSSFFLIILTGLSVLVSGITIFLFKDRKTQLKLSVAGVVIGIILIILYFLEVGKFQSGNFALTSLFVFCIPIGYVFAARGIWKDEKLVKSLNKLR